LASIRQTITGFFADDTPLFSSLTDNTLDNAVAYFNRVDDQSQIRDKIKELYGHGIKAGDSDSKDSIETYVKQGFSTQVDAGMVEALSIGFGNKIVNALATLFTEEGQSFDLATDTNDNPEAAEELLDENREAGGFSTAMVRTDKLSIQTGSAALLLGYAAGSVQYQHIGPNAIRALFNKTIEENGAMRATDERDIEDATVVIIRLAAASVNKWTYLAIFGRSEEYPQGRYVQYEAGNTLDVPPVGAKGLIEYELEGGGVANPLSYWAATNPDENLPEYPVAVIYSGLTDSNTTFPTTTSLYSTCQELSCAASHTLSAVQDATTGTKVIERDEVASGKPLPQSLSGAVSLAAGQKFTFVGHDSAACKAAYEIIREMMVDVASSYSVPDYMAVSNQNMLDADSGVALAIKTRPLKKFRNFRAAENAQSVRKIFEIEKVLISLHAVDGGDSTAINELYACVQKWSAGELKMPENKNEVAVRVASMLDKGVYDTIAAIREVHQLGSDADAIAYYERMKDRAAEYPPPAVEETKPVIGLPGRSRPVTT